MSSLNTLQIGLELTFIVFSFAFGACAGSLINVLVYRMPRGLDVIWTPSRCPACETPLTFRENIPVFGWLALGGRCRFCRSKISAEYPLVEFLVGTLWALMFLVYFALPEHTTWLGIDITSIRPEWAAYDAQVDGWPRSTWPIFIVHLLLVASLVAMTLVDAKTYTIPLAMPWAALIVGIAFHTLGAALTQASYSGVLRSHAPGACWAIPTPNWLSTSRTAGWWWTGASLGAVIGLMLSNLFLHFKLVRRSFADYPAWELEQLKAHGIDPDAPTPESKDEGVPVGEHVGPGVRLVLTFVLVWALAIAAGALATKLGLAGSLGWPLWAPVAAGFLVGPLLAALACRPLARAQSAPTPAGEQGSTAQVPTSQASPARVDDSFTLSDPTSDIPHPTSDTPSTPHAPDLWIAYPHARREMLKELIFLTPVLALGWLGGTVADHLGSGHIPPLWLLVLCGSIMGALIGGGLIWAVRIGGSLAFGKEAMGLGDVHLMAGVGACTGWIDAVLALPLAAVVGLYFVIISILSNRPAGRTMPFGPYLAVGTLIAMFGKPLIEHGLTYLTGNPVNLP